MAHNLTDSAISQIVNYGINSEDDIISETENSLNENPTDNIQPSIYSESSSDETNSDEEPLSRYVANTSANENQMLSKMVNLYGQEPH
ncbi:unnamed protein product [Parnassius apollo]|uniref:(apollo) hypothetical protein n=1 Tax=Parnassius apollo TaxID=110799 RepID=A0A8S3XV25_PARAO|nr:unnamed protein product [Parnassius apollo]